VQVWGRGHDGELPSESLVAGFAPMPVVRMGPAPDASRSGGIQPAHQRWFNRRPAVSFPAMHGFDDTRQPRDRGDDLRAPPLKADMRAIRRRHMAARSARVMEGPDGRDAEWPRTW
jgi:hypothetical protein